MPFPPFDSADDRRCYADCAINRRGPTPRRAHVRAGRHRARDEQTSIRRAHRPFNQVGEVSARHLPTPAHSDRRKPARSGRAARAAPAGRTPWAPPSVIPDDAASVRRPSCARRPRSAATGPRTGYRPRPRPRTSDASTRPTDTRVRSAERRLVALRQGCRTAQSAPSKKTEARARRDRGRDSRAAAAPGRPSDSRRPPDRRGGASSHRPRDVRVRQANDAMAWSSPIWVGGYPSR